MSASQQAPPAKSDSLGLSYLISAYQVRGHEMANLDPLGIHAFRSSSTGPQELDYKYHGFTDGDLDRQMNLLGNSSGGNVGFLDILGSRPNITLRQVISNLQKTYCSSLGVEYMHMVILISYVDRFTAVLTYRTIAPRVLARSAIGSEARWKPRSGCNSQKRRNSISMSAFCSQDNLKPSVVILISL